jgi:hypothetical protein
MSVDLQVIFPQEQIQLNSVRLVPNSFYMLDVIGSDFRSVEAVYVNQVESQNFIVLSQTRLLAQVPESARAGVITDVQVLARKLALTHNSLIKFTLSNNPQMVTGLLKLVQLFLIILLNTRNSDKFDKGRGASALRAIGKTFGADKASDVVGDFVIAVNTATKQIVGMQSRSTTLPRDERLLSAKVVQARFSREINALIVSVEVTSMAGRAALANMEV